MKYLILAAAIAVAACGPAKPTEAQLLWCDNNFYAIAAAGDQMYGHGW